MDTLNTNDSIKPGTQGEPMQDQQALHAQMEHVQLKLDKLQQDLRSVDAELEGLAAQRQQFQLLEQACMSLEQLDELGASDAFWGEHLALDRRTQLVRDNRRRLEVFQEHLGKIESRRASILNWIAQEQDTLAVLDEDLYEVQQQEERRKLEWIVEREASPQPERPQVMAWGGDREETQRLRRALAASLLLAALLGAVLPMIDLPLPERGQPVEVPERLVQLVQQKVRPVPPRPVEEQPKPERQEEQKPPREQPEQKAEAPQLASAPQAPEKQAAQAGILAFREKFSSLRQSSISPRLGRDARISSADENTVGRTERSMLTKLGPGSSGGINLAGLSRDVGGGGGGGGLEGVQVARVTSGIGGSGAEDRPLSGGPGLGRSDEEIQIVFDRHKAALYRLYNRELRKDPTLRGQMVLRLTIEPDGSVSICALQSSDMNAPELAAQIVDRVGTFDFGAKDVQVVTIVYPIDFLPTA